MNLDFEQHFECERIGYVGGETMNDKNATHTTGMSDAAKESRRAYYKAWRAKTKTGYTNTTPTIGPSVPNVKTKKEVKPSEI